MHVEVDLGFSSLLVLVLCAVVVPVILLVTRRKWRAAATRKEEIRRLLVLAAEEASRAEFEASVSYGAVSVSRNNYQCAVCFCPTTTRCARCKAVRYCSGKCQIIHWRRGHKEECHPPTTTYDDKSNYQKVASQDQHDMYDGRYNDRSVETSFQKPVLSDSILSPEASVGESIKVDPVLDTEGTDFIHESPGTSFSGFSTPTGSSFSDFSTPEFSDSDSLDSFATLSKPNQSKPHGNDGKSQCSSSSLCHSISSKNDDSILKPAKVSLDFWGRTLDSGVNSSDAKDNSSLPNSCGPGNSKSVDDESFLHFKFNLSGSVPPSLHAKSLKVNDSISDDAIPSASQGKPIDKVALSEKNSIDAPQVKSSSCMSYERSNHMDNDASSDSNASSERKSVSSSSYSAHLSSSTGGFKLDTDASKVCRSPTSRSERSNVVVNDPIGTPHLSKSRLSSTAPQTHLTSSISRQSVSNVRLGKVENVEPGAAFSSQMASCSPSSVNGLKSSVWKVVDQFRGPKSGRYSDKGLSLYDLFVKLYTSNKVDMQPCGLINCGNSCYANVVLQCLAFTPPLTAYFAQGLHSKACVNKDCCFSCEFENLILKAKEGKSPLSPIGILSQLQSIGSPLTNGREEDAHEFLRYAIDAMDSHEETSLMGLTFGGYLRSKIKCMKCHYKSERPERMMDLTVEIEGDIGKLEDALKRFTGTEILDGNNKYQCSRCKSYEKAKKKLTILEAPNILTIALKRFQSGKFGKLNKSIRFPEILDLAPYMSGTSDKSPIYRLYGVVVHLDVMNAAFSGHYVCYVKNIQNKWFKIDDSTVTAVELERALTKGAYMLLYARCSPRAPRLIRNRIVSADPKNKCSPSKINPKNTALESRTTSVQPSVVQLLPDSIPPDSLASVESFYLKFHRLQRILEEDSSSDLSFTSSNSDEGSCSTDSTRDSASTDDLSDNIFGGWNNSWGNPSDSDTSSSSSSSSPLYSRHSRHAHMNQSGSSFHERSRSRIHADSIVGGDDPWDRIPSEGSRLVDLQGNGGNYLFDSDKSRQCRKLAGSSSSSCCRENDSSKLGSSDVKSGVSFRRSVSERTD